MSRGSVAGRHNRGRRLYLTQLGAEDEKPLSNSGKNFKMAVLQISVIKAANRKCMSFPQGFYPELGTCGIFKFFNSKNYIFIKFD